jgi:hypothetical protein
LSRGAGKARSPGSEGAPARERAGATRQGVDRDANIDAARAAADGDLTLMRALFDPAVEPARRSQRR